MFAKIFSSLGNILGKELFGNGILSSITRFAGGLLGNYLDKADDDTEEIYKYQNIHTKFYINVARYGQVIPLVFGKAKLLGKVIWVSDINLINTDNQEYVLRKNGSDKIIHNITNKYLASFALSICEGEILDIYRVWHNNELIDLSLFNFRLYKGTECQSVDPTIASYFPQGQVPAFRGLSYIVFYNVDLANFHYIIPNFYFEVIRKPNVKLNASTEEYIRSMVLIPGSGEYVYDPVVQYKFIKTCNNVIIGQEKINSHNYLNIANSIFSLNQLQATCPNVSSVAPVVCWFADSLNIADCKIKPAVEFKDNNVTYSEEWQVGSFNRENAKLIGRDSNNKPRYGGSVNDNSVIRYLIELRKRNLKIMFYPMIFLDLPNKPWRGHLTGDYSVVKKFFQNEYGYNKFILHYANLVKDYVDSFIIGSELIGLTKIRDITGNYPAVQELISLANQVKMIVGNDVLVSYAADWSEYHHTDGGWYNLDDLWSASSIDFIGIDAYFPITNIISSNINYQDIINGFGKGEGYDYYLDNNDNKHHLDAKYAWKNIRYWWENFHYNPNGITTSWIPKSKKIWFTEFGFPSIDKASNKPNVFFDPLCLDGGVPKYSNGETNFNIQRKAIKGFIEYWQQEEYIDNMFLWTWDARSSPAWPFMDIWQDGYLWAKGHWVNDKFGVAVVANIILELSKKCGIQNNIINVVQLDETIHGLVINQSLTGLEIINILRIVSFFDIKTCLFNEILFMKRAEQTSCVMANKALVKTSNSHYFSVEHVSIKQIASKLDLYFIDYLNNYNLGYCHLNREYSNVTNTISIRLPVLFSKTEITKLGETILCNAQQENKIIRFLLLDDRFCYLPGDMLIIEYLGIKYQIRIICVNVKDNLHEITAASDDLSIYKHQEINIILEDFNVTFPVDVIYKVIELPPNIFPNIKNNSLVTYLYSVTDEMLYLNNNAGEYKKLGKVSKGAIFGKLVDIKQHQVNIYLIDEQTEITIFCYDQVNTRTNQLLLIGREIIRYQCIEELGNNLYKISNLIRGIGASEDFINHELGEEVIFLEYNPNFINLDNIPPPHDLIFIIRNNKIEFKPSYISKYLPLPYIKSYDIIETSIYINVVARIYNKQKSDTNIKFLVKIDSKYYSYKFIKQDNLIIINSTAEELNAGVNICIISQNDRHYSLPKFIEVKR